MLPLNVQLCPVYFPFILFLLFLSFLVFLRGGRVGRLRHHHIVIKQYPPSNITQTSNPSSFVTDASLS